MLNRHYLDKKIQLLSSQTMFQHVDIYEVLNLNGCDHWASMNSHCHKSLKSRTSWYDTAAAINIKLHQCIHKTKSGKPTLVYFDGPTMVSYQILPAFSD